MKHICLALLFCLICLPAQWAFAALVSETVVSDGDQGQYASIALDSSGVPHVAWFDATDGNLMYATRNFAGWQVQQVDTGWAGHYASIAIQPGTGHPAIAYYDQTAAKAKYAELSGSWQTETIVYSDDVDEGQWCDLAFAGDGVPFVSYYYENGILHSDGINVVWKAGKAWEGERVDYYSRVVGLTGLHTSIAISSADYPQVAYRDNVTASLRFGWEDGLGWTAANTTNPANHNFGKYSDLVLDAGDNPFISTWVEKPSDDNCVALVSNILDVWSIEEIQCGPGNDFGSHASIAMGSDGEPRVVFNAQDELRYADRSSGSWAIETLDTAGTNPYWTGLTLSDTDQPHVVYYNATGKDLEYLWDMPLPTVSGVDPDTGPNDGVISDVSVTGLDLDWQCAVDLVHAESKAEISASDVTAISATELTCDFDLKDAPVGQWDLRVTNPAGTDTLADAFETTCGAPQANFTANTSSGSAPLVVSFSDTSEATTSCDIESWSWKFGDGDTSDQENPQHTYGTPGTYTVELTVTSSGGVDTKTREDLIEVSQGGDDDDSGDDDDTGDDDDDSGDDDDSDFMPGSDQNESSRDSEDSGCGK